MDGILKENIIKLVIEHKAECLDPECGISLHLVHVLLTKAGIKLTKDEVKYFV